MRGLPQPRQGWTDTGISSTASRRGASTAAAGQLPVRLRSAACGLGASHRWLTLQVALQGSAMDPTTGTIDMDLIQTGISAGARTARAQLTQELRTLIQSERPPPPLPTPFSLYAVSQY